MTFEFDSSYFFKLSEGIINAQPGTYEVRRLTKDPEKFFNHLKWYNISRPREFNEVCIVHDELISIYKSEYEKGN
jgi:hypothetical protein